jgi:hypothetical protein
MQANRAKEERFMWTVVRDAAVPASGKVGKPISTGNPRDSTTVGADVAGVSGPDSSLALQVGHRHPVRVIRTRPGQKRAREGL